MVVVAAQNLILQQVNKKIKREPLHCKVVKEEEEVGGEQETEEARQQEQHLI